jgi:hypothetical protein
MIRSWIIFVFLFVCGLVTLRSLAAQQKDVSRAGWISDEACGAKHTKAGGADCVQKCWREVLRWDTRNGNPNEPSLLPMLMKESG